MISDNSARQREYSIDVFMNQEENEREGGMSCGIASSTVASAGRHGSEYKKGVCLARDYGPNKPPSKPPLSHGTLSHQR